MSGGWSESLPRFLLEMLKSIFTTDIYILVCAVITGVLVPRIYSAKNTIARKLEKMPNNPDWATHVRRKLNSGYSLFLALISIFPLLGMFGTVAALLNLDFSDMAANLDSVKTDFFHALTSTAWGIVFSVVFKLINARLFFDVDDIYDDIDRIVRAQKPAPEASDAPAPREKKRPRLRLPKLTADDDDEEEDDVFGGDGYDEK